MKRVYGHGSLWQPIHKEDIRKLLSKNNHKGVGNFLPNAKKKLSFFSSSSL